VIATDFDHTLVWKDGELRPRTIAALRRANDAGLRVIVVTGRMVQSVQRYLEPLGFDEALVCYQGAVVVAEDGTWLLHRPIPLELAREAIAAVQQEGYNPNVYVGDKLYVSSNTPEALGYAGFQQLNVHTVGDVLEWVSEPPTKLVCVGDPVALDGLELLMKERFGTRMHISKSLPHFLEFAAAGVTKGSGLEFLSERLGFTRDETISFGDGENDVELIEWAGYGIAVENAHARVKALADWVCPPVIDEGVALVVDAYLDSLS
jgi:Cof subfamily protein (haloacid dehalogenase superfamily)